MGSASSKLGPQRESTRVLNTITKSHQLTWRQRDVRPSRLDVGLSDDAKQDVGCDARILQYLGQEKELNRMFVSVRVECTQR